MTSRESIYEPILKNISGLVVEVGTCWGSFAEYLFRQTRRNGAQVLTIDPYKKFSKEEYCDALNEMSQADCDKKFEMVKNRLVPQGIIMGRMTSYKASGLIQDEVVSFCYLDGNHHYNAVLLDLIRWWPKIKEGGWLCGDDVEDRHKLHDDEGNVFVEHQKGSYGKYGVYQALEDFAKCCPSFRFTIRGNQFLAQKKNAHQ